jgi:retron-type reverse transcriptase
MAEINRRPVGVDGIPFEAYRSPRDHTLWNPNVLYVFDDPNPLKYLQLRILHKDAPDPAEQIYANGRPVERGTVADALINRAISRKLNKNLDRFFNPASWGYRPCRSTELAIQQVRQAIRGGAHWTLKCDVKRFFPNINRNLLRQQLDQTIHDQALIELIMSQVSPVLITKAGVHVLERTGLPEGNGLTPWLSNLYLHCFDQICTTSFAFYARYADDLLVLGHSQEEVLKAKCLIQTALSRLGLELNRDKTIVRDLYRQPITFLGYELRGGNIYPPSKGIRQLEAISKPSVRRS